MTPKFKLLGWLILTFCFILPAAAKTEAKSPYRWDNVRRVVAIGDLHGRKDALDDILFHAGLVDSKGKWAGEDTHLVITGDFLDRGPDERKIMDDLMRLQKQARAAKGRVHILLANHEIMNLIGDWRYVPKEGFYSFRSMEIGQDRQLAKRAFQKIQNKNEDTESRTPQPNFDQLFVDGYFGRVRAFSRNGKYGKWLLKQPTVIVVNDVAYVHGGLVPEIASWGVSAINQHVWDALEQHLRAADALTEYGWFNGAHKLPDRREIAEAIVAQADEFPSNSRAVVAAKEYLAYWDDPVFGAEGPFWYRGYCQDDEVLVVDALEDALSSLKAKKMAVGHTPTEGHIATRFNGKLIRLDVGMAYGAPARSVEWIDGSPRARLEQGKLVAPVQDPIYGEPISSVPIERPMAEISDWLRTADLKASRPLGRGRSKALVMTLQYDRSRLLSVFKTINDPETNERFTHEIAAYYLSERLGWKLVPPTVGRKIGNQQGSLQLWIGGSVDLKTLKKKTGILPNFEVDPEKLAQIRLFDAIIGLEDRSPADILVRIREQEVWLVDHAEAFQLGSAVRDDVLNNSAALNTTLLADLAKIDEDWLENAFKDLLSAKQIQAISERINSILALAETKNITKSNP